MLLKQQLFYDSGDIWYTSYYLLGLKHGEQLSFHRNGRLQSKVEFINGKKNGYCFFFYDNGGIYEIHFYKMGEIDGESIVYDEEGNIKYRNRYSNGKILVWHLGE